MLRVSNPPNPWDSVHAEWLGEPPPARLEVFEENARSLLSENDSPDIGFRWSVNPYRGCFHACSYCYARPTHEYLGFGAGTDFERKIVVKVNAPGLLRREISRRGWKGEAIAFSGNTDCYQPLEAVYGLTRRCLEVCADVENPVHLITKGALVRRDVDLLAAMARSVDVSVFVSIPFADDAMARLVEPGASPPSQRFETLAILSNAGVPTGVGVAPIIPGLTDSQIPEILARARRAGAEDAFFQALRLPGATLPVFRERIAEAFPQRAVKIANAIRGMRGGRWNDPRFVDRMHGSGPRWAAIETLFRTEYRRLGFGRRRVGWKRAGSPDLPEAVPRAHPRRTAQIPLFDGAEEDGALL
ncbi:MAG TPA: PA0069 family radical SAM protein [Thermoanaerobaculia bacterium]|nr:PA0069 family radical SAM protein [Thermoanaerobaculia bacterium]